MRDDATLGHASSGSDSSRASRDCVPNLNNKSSVVVVVVSISWMAVAGAAAAAAVTSPGSGKGDFDGERDQGAGVKGRFLLRPDMVSFRCRFTSFVGVCWVSL